MSRGYVYILDNPALSSELLKIGKTTKDVELRARGLSTTGLPEDFRVLYFIEVPDCHLAEAIVHKRLANHRARSNREFFRVPLTLAKSVLDEVAVVAMSDNGRSILAKEYGTAAGDDENARLSKKEQFEHRLQRCPDYVKDMYASLEGYLLALDGVAFHVEKKGEGRIYSRHGKAFCRMDPKFRDAWIGVKIQGVDPAIIETVAKVRDRLEKYWIFMMDPGKVDDLKKVLEMAYQSRG
jgi:hypothetical protein